MDNLLELRALDAGYGEICVIRAADIAIRAKCVTAIVGSNGAGKTTLMRAISGLIRPTAGSIIFSGTEVTREPAHRRVALGISLVPEGRLVFPDFTVEETLRVGAFVKRAQDGWVMRREQMYEIFPRLKQRRGALAGSLSGGEQQMLALARGLMSVPTLLLLDEPSLGLSPMMAEEVFDRLGAIRDLGTTICLVEQNVFSALTVADHAFVLEHGHVVMKGTGAELLATPEIRSSFLGL